MLDHKKKASPSSWDKQNKATRPSTKDDVGLDYASTNDDDRENGIGKGAEKNVQVINMKDVQDINDDPNIKHEEQDLRLLVVGPESHQKDWTTGIRGTVCSIAYFLTTSVVLMFFMNFVHQRMPRDAPPLPDIGHQLIPKMEPEKLGDITMMMLVFMMISAMILHRNRWPILINFFVTLGNLYLVRVVSISVTSLPATQNHCRDNYQPIENIYMNTLKGLITFGSSNIHCGDLMFSGHTCMVTNIWMTFMINYKRKYPVTISATLLLVLTFFFIIATRSHYTGDIWIAFWLTALMHKVTPYVFPYTKSRISRFLKTSF